MPETPKMATSKAKKTDQLQRLQSQMASAQGLAFLAFSAPTVGEMESVRKYLRENEMTCTVIKKTLIALAAKNAKKAEFTRDPARRKHRRHLLRQKTKSPPRPPLRISKKSFLTKKPKRPNLILAEQFLRANSSTPLPQKPSAPPQVASSQWPKLSAPSAAAHAESTRSSSSAPAESKMRSKTPTNSQKSKIFLL